MSERSETVWTCDRCGTRKAMSYGTQPSWWRLVVGYPPRSAEPTTKGDLCPDCRGDFLHWWENPAAAPGPAVYRLTWAPEVLDRALSRLEEIRDWWDAPTSAGTPPHPTPPLLHQQEAMATIDALRQLLRDGIPPAGAKGLARCPSCGSDDKTRTRRCPIFVGLGVDPCVMPAGHNDRRDPAATPHLSEREAQGYDRECGDPWHANRMELDQ